MFCLSFYHVWDWARRTPGTTGWDCHLLILTQGGFQVGRVKKLVSLALHCSHRWKKQRHNWMQNQIWWLFLFKGGTACRNPSSQGNVLEYPDYSEEPVPKCMGTFLLPCRFIHCRRVFSGGSTTGSPNIFAKKCPMKLSSHIRQTPHTLLKKILYVL